jgi:transcriptional regulator with XRE-family HTH domain
MDGGDMGTDEDRRDSGRADDAMKAAFAQRLLMVMRERGWTQSELARRARIGRDNVSGYIRGKNLPGPAILNRLAAALSVGPEELIPMPEQDIPNGRKAHGFTLRHLADDGNRVWLQVEQALPWDQAEAILRILGHSLQRPPALPAGPRAA